MLEGAVLTGGVELAGAVEPSMEDLEELALCLVQGLNTLLLQGLLSL